MKPDFRLRLGNHVRVLGWGFLFAMAAYAVLHGVAALMRAAGLLTSG